jgi:1,2-phenylacetyl-CoA epoxidase PaaB subunit
MRPDRSRLYHVFARREVTEPLRQVGTVHAPDETLAAVYAATTYDEEQWLDMRIVPADCLMVVYDRTHIRTGNP